jgi:hypothetical protein
MSIKVLLYVIDASSLDDIHEEHRDSRINITISAGLSLIILSLFFIFFHLSHYNSYHCQYALLAEMGKLNYDKLWQSITQHVSPIKTYCCRNLLRLYAISFQLCNNRYQNTHIRNLSIHFQNRYYWLVEISFVH